MFKNTASQKLAIFAFDATTGLPKTGDAANITAYVSKDWGSVTVLGDTSATEMDATNAKGMYLFDLTQAETNADTLIFTAKSSTANIALVPQIISTLPANFTKTGIDSSGNVTANVTQRLGVAEKPRYVGTAQAGSSGSITLQAGTTALQCEPGDTIELTGGTGQGQSAYVTAFDSGTAIATILGTWPTANPTNTSTYEITKRGGGVPATPQDIATATWSNSTAPVRQVEVITVAGVSLQLNGSGTQSIGGP